MKDCGPKWADYKKEKNVKGRAEYRKFMSTLPEGLSDRCQIPNGPPNAPRASTRL